MSNAAAELTGEDGPFAGQELPRRDLALLTWALAVNASRWPEEAHARYREERRRLGRDRHFQAKEEVARQFGHGVLDAGLMREAPGFGATLVGLGTVPKDTARVFDVPLPPSMSGDSVHRAMVVTLAWFSPMDSSRARYRLAALEAVAADGDEFGDGAADRGWHLAMKNGHLDGKMIKRGTLWLRRMVHNRVRLPDFEDGATLPIRVRCRDASGGGLNPDDDIRFAMAVTLEVAGTVRYDVHHEVRDALRVRVRDLGRAGSSSREGTAVAQPGNRPDSWRRCGDSHPSPTTPCPRRSDITPTAPLQTERPFAGTSWIALT